MIGIIVATTEEKNELEVYLKDIEKIKYANKEFTIGNYKKFKIVICLSGVGKVNAAISTCLMIEKFNPSYILNAGSCGSLQKDINITDVIIADKVSYCDVDVPNWDISSNNPKITFNCDEKLLAHSKKKIDKKLYHGLVVSCDSFVYKDKQVEDIKKYFPNALGVEMEAGAVLHCANCFEVPCLIIRGVSDNVLLDNNELTFDEYLKDASLQSARYCFDFIESYDIC